MTSSTDRFTEAVSNNGRAEPVQIWKARNFIHKNSGEAISLGKVARAANISANHLSEKFKEVTGIRFVDYVARIRFEKARELLHDPNLRISEIAFAVGFQSLSQFNRVFKRLSGKSPTEYRARIFAAPKAALGIMRAPAQPARPSRLTNIARAR